MKRKNKVAIAIFAAYMPPHVGGIERYTSNLVKQFLDLGYQPIVVTSNYDGEKEFEVVDGVVMIRLPIYETFKNRYPIVKLGNKKKELMRLLDDYNIKAIIVNTRFHLTSHVGVSYAKHHNIPVYLIEHGSNYVTLDNKFIDFFANRYEDILTFRLKNKIAGFYGVSEACGKWLKHFKIEATGTWYNSIDFKQDVLEKIPHEGINFLYAGRIIKQKGVYNILMAFKELSLKYENINLYIAGDGSELETYKREFNYKGIYFLGKLEYDELVKYYANCDVFLYPPLWPEGLPTSILEAGLMRCAVIGTDQGGIKEIISNGENGLIISGEIKDLKKAMELLIKNEDLRKKYADVLYETVRDKFSWEVTAKKIVKDIKLK